MQRTPKSPPKERIPGAPAIEQRLDKLGKTKAGLARALRIKPPRVSEILNGTRKLSAAEVQRAAEFLEWPVPRVLDIFGIEPAARSLSMLTIAGFVETDNVTMSHDATLETVEAPSYLASFEGKFIKVSDDTMAPRYRKGDLLGYFEDPDDITDILGKDAIIDMGDGQLLLKAIHLGSEPDRYVLVSNNLSLPPIVNAAVKAVYRIRVHIP